MSKRRFISLETRLEEKRVIQQRYQQSLDIYKPTRFTAWDGEGFTIDKIHYYGLLMNSENNIMYHLQGLSSLECLNFLCDNAQGYLGETNIHVCFAANYDVNMMLRGFNHDIPRATLEPLYKGEKVVWKNFSMEWRPRKSFTLGRFKLHQKHFLFNPKTEKWEPNFDAKITLWDVFGFFQSSFLNALNTFFNPDELQELGYQQIKEGKERRDTFTPDELQNFIIPYTTLEVNALVKLMERLNGYCNEAKIRLKRWDGAGAVAAAILDKHQIKKYYGDIPQDLMLPTQHAYGGGRNELLKYGHYEGAIYHKDIQSAFPSVQVDLPDLASGQWVHIYRGNIIFPEKECLSLYKIRWEFPQNLPLYPFFYRDMFGQITYPSHGINWVYWYELNAVRKFADKLKGKVDLLEQWLYVPGSDIKPYSFIRDYYKYKLYYKSIGNGVYIVFKLGINSLYGKTVQHLGYDEDTGRLPPYFQLQYGGAITSKIRARLFEAAMLAPTSVIGIATDGIWYTQEVPELNCSTELGAWDCEILQAGTFVQSGVYFVDKADGKKVHRFRGFDKENFTEEKVLEAWKNGHTHLDISCTRFVTLGSALSSNERLQQAWGNWETGMRTLVTHPCKGRKRTNIDVWTPEDNPSMRLFPTYPRNDEGYLGYLNNEISYPFPLPWNGRKEYDAFKAINRQEEEILHEIEDSQEFYTEGDE